MDGEEKVRVRKTAKVGERKSGRGILNTRELTEQIHLPTLSYSAYLSPFSPILPPSSAFRSFSLSLSLSSVSSLAFYSPN